MHLITVSYFDSIIGPTLLVVAPPGKSMDYPDKIPDLMFADLNGKLGRLNSNAVLPKIGSRLLELLQSIYIR